MAHVIGNVFHFFQLPAKRETEICADKSGRCYLVEQRREAMEIVAVNQTYFIFFQIEVFYQVQTCEATSYNYNFLHDNQTL